MRGDVGKVTIYSVAARAEVSISTVSLVMNAPHRVSADTRERVVRAAAELGYRTGTPGRGPAASGLRIAVAAPFSSYPTYFRRLSGMMARARGSAIDLIPHDLESAAAADAPFLDALPAQRGVDGVIVMGVPIGAAAIRASRAAALPVVLVDVRRTRTSDRDLPTVLVDDQLGGRMLGEHLAARGHRRALFLHEPQKSTDYVSAGMLRAQGLMESLELVEVTVASGADPAPQILAALRDAPDVTAVIANHDTIAAQVLRALADAGISVPARIAVAGYDDGDAAEALRLTTVRQPFEESGSAALDLLLAALSESESSIHRVLLTPSLVVRSSS